MQPANYDNFILMIDAMPMAIHLDADLVLNERKPKQYPKRKRFKQNKRK